MFLKQLRQQGQRYLVVEVFDVLRVLLQHDGISGQEERKSVGCHGAVDAQLVFELKWTELVVSQASDSRQKRIRQGSNDKINFII